MASTLEKCLRRLEEVRELPGEITALWGTGVGGFY